MENRGDMDHDQDDEGEGHEHLYPTSCGGYYVQSPSTISHANTTTSTYFINPDYSAFSISHIDTDHPNHNQCHQLFISTLNHDDHDDDDRDDDDDDDQLISSHYLLRHVHGNHNKTKNNYDINEDHDRGRTSGEELVGRINNKDEDDDDDDDYLYLNGKKRSAGWLSYNYSEDSIGWICIQMSWRCIFSICVALLVFYLVTKPPPPKVSVKVNGVNEFLLGEGLDASGVSTKLLTFNCSINLFVLNKSKLFGLHVQTPSIQFSFGPLILFASSSSSSSSSSPQELDNYMNLLKWKIYVGTKSKPLYGAGRVMDDMLHSKKGLPLFFTLNFSSHSRVVWDLIRPTFHHHARCLLLLHPYYDKKHRTQSYNTTCTIS